SGLTLTKESASYKMDGSTIAAVATPIGSGGIGIIKISGKDALSIAASLFRKSKPTSSPPVNRDSSSDATFKSYQLYHGYVVNPENKKIVDEVLLSVMKAPRSYTREDIVEINAHSGPVAISSILDLVLRHGARLAEPGEFTKRAFLNGRIDLTQAEAVIDIINAKTDKSLEIATTQIKGDMRAAIEGIRDSLLAILTDIEAAIDFPEDVGDILDTEGALEHVELSALEPLRELVGLYQNAHVLRDGLRMAVVGRPNVGKSSLMNRLIKKDRAIVTSVPGTTRDLIEETLNIRGIPVIISDMAGFHETDDPVEVIGLTKAQECIENSDLVLFMVDVSEALTVDDDKIYEIIKDRTVVLVINKIDLVGENTVFEIPDRWEIDHRMNISALYNMGVDALKDLIAAVCVGGSGLEIGNMNIPNLRQKVALDRSLQAIEAFVTGLRNGIHSELGAIDLEEGVSALGEILGISVKEDVLDQIFSRFSTPLNNAKIVSVSTYHDFVPQFLNMIKRTNNDLELFYKECQKLAKKPKTERDLDLHAYSP
ncbi:tRNA uridine-5-carboxymethylaminomethyl(34) synthesis GTPase MnmE, partial [Thermodesulfobacteriota bacterium]